MRLTASTGDCEHCDCAVLFYEVLHVYDESESPMVEAVGHSGGNGRESPVLLENCIFSTRGERSL